MDDKIYGDGFGCFDTSSILPETDAKSTYRMSHPSLVPIA